MLFAFEMFGTLADPSSYDESWSPLSPGRPAR